MGADLIRYDLLVQDALRSVVKKVLGDAARNGLPGEHHFNISFKTRAAGVVLPHAIRQRYPEEMAIILQHEFWDLAVSAEHFQVSLNFSRRPERLTVPFDAITGFSDPSVPFGFKLEPRETATPALAAETPPTGVRELRKPGSKAPEALSDSKSPARLTAPAKSEGPEGEPQRAPASKAQPQKALADKAHMEKAEKAPAETVEPENGQATKVVSIDAFRKK